MPNLIESIKKASLEAVEASKPCAVMFGSVTSEIPFKISVEQKLALTETQLIMTKDVTYYSIGDKILLLRMQGGQKYVLMDKVI